MAAATALAPDRLPVDRRVEENLRMVRRANTTSAEP